MVTIVINEETKKLLLQDLSLKLTDNIKALEEIKKYDALTPKTDEKDAHDKLFEFALNLNLMISDPIVSIIIKGLTDLSLGNATSEAFNEYIGTLGSDWDTSILLAQAAQQNAFDDIIGEYDFISEVYLKADQPTTRVTVSGDSGDFYGEVVLDFIF